MFNASVATNDSTYKVHTTLEPWNVYTNDTNETIPLCKRILLEELGGHSVRIWDLSILIPNLIFLVFLVYKFKRIKARLSSSHSPVFAAFYALVYITAIINTLRCIVSMLLSSLDLNGTIPDKVLWLCSVFCLFSSELSILSFGLLFGHLDSNTSIRRVLAVTTTIGFVYICIQAIFEFISRHVYYSTDTNRIVLFSHGGIDFWFWSSIILGFIYASVCFLPFVKLRRRLILPTKRRFYIYCAFLSLLNFVQAVGASMISKGQMSGMCVVCVTSYVYFAFYAPIVYLAFLRGRVSNPQPSLHFSYKLQKDDELQSSSSTGASPFGSRFGVVPSTPWPISQRSPFDEFLYQTPTPDDIRAGSFSPSLYDTTDLSSPVLDNYMAVRSLPTISSPTRDHYHDPATISSASTPGLGTEECLWPHAGPSKESDDVVPPVAILELKSDDANDTDRGHLDSSVNNIPLTLHKENAERKNV